MKIGLIKKKNSKCIFLMPEQIKILTSEKINVNLVKGYGSFINIDDSCFSEAGAKIFKNSKEVIKNSDIILNVDYFTNSEAKLMSNSKLAISMENFNFNTNFLNTMLTNNCNSLAWEMLSNGKEYIFFPIIQKMIGYYSVIKALEMLQSNFEKICSKTFFSNYKNNNIHVLILNCSYAGYQALITSLSLGANVIILDADLEYTKKLLSNDGIKKILELNSSKLIIAKNDFETLTQEIKKCDVFINTLTEPNSRNKKRITSAMAQTMKKGSVLIDAGAEAGLGFEFQNLDAKKDICSFAEISYSSIKDIKNTFPLDFSQMISIESIQFLVDLAKFKTINDCCHKMKDLLITRDKKIVNSKILKEIQE